jgi:hypothetical protein
MFKKLTEIGRKFMKLSFYQKVKFVIKLGAYVVVFLDVMDYALEKFKAVKLDLPETKEAVSDE